MTSPFQAFVGSAIHRAIPRAIGLRLDPSDPDAMLELACEVIGADRYGSRRARILVASRTALYLRRYCPPTPWKLVGVESPLGSGRTDLQWLWEQLDGPVHRLIDELKSASILYVRTDSRVLAQRDRYEASALRVHGASSLGVRVVALGAPSGTLLTSRALELAPAHPWLAGQR